MGRDLEKMTRQIINRQLIYTNNFGQASLDRITISMHSKFNCISVYFDRIQHGIYLIQIISPEFTSSNSVCLRKFVPFFVYMPALDLFSLFYTSRVYLAVVSVFTSWSFFTSISCMHQRSISFSNFVGQICQVWIKS